MDFKEYQHGKVILNELIQEIKLSNTVLKVNYWGAIEKHFNTAMHQHSFYEICFVLNGMGAYVDEKNYYEIRPNTLIITLPERKHQLISETGVELLYVAFDFDYPINEYKLEMIIQGLHLNTTSIHYLEENNSIKSLWTLLLSEASNYMEGEVNHLYIHSLSQTLALSLILKGQNLSIDHVDFNRKVGSTEKIIEHVKRYVKDNLDSSLKLKDIADSLYISTRHLSRIFSEQEGVPFSDFIQRIRLQEATRLLKVTNMSVGEIAKKTGYNSIHYFSKVFSEKMGDTPRDFRQLYSNEKIAEYKAITSNNKVKQIIK